jgi:tRNA G18 (ribose-2'-O)-methylase SpoU
MRGWFGIGIYGVTKAGNFGALVRTAQGFGAAFAFAVDAQWRHGDAWADTSDGANALPVYDVPDFAALPRPRGAQLVAIELSDDAVALPSFRHPATALYVLGRERLGLPPALLSEAAHVVQIPARFSLNVATAAAIVMYDRLLSLGGYPARPLQPGGSVSTPPNHQFGGPRLRTERA